MLLAGLSQNVLPQLIKQRIKRWRRVSRLSHDSRDRKTAARDDDLFPGKNLIDDLRKTGLGLSERKRSHGAGLMTR